MRIRISIVAAAAVLLALGAANQAGAQFQPGEFITYSQDSWGANPPGTAGQLLVDRFDFVYPDGAVEVGIQGLAGYSVFFSSAFAILNFLPASGTPASLTGDLVDPTSTSSGVFGGFVLALQLDVDFTDAEELAGSAGIPFGDLVLVDTSYALFNGLSVRQYLAEANGFLGGELPPYTYDEVAFLTEDLTLAFEGGTPTQWAQDQLRVVRRGDLDCNAQVDFGDINPFVLYLSNFTAWAATYPDCPPENGDINADGTYGQASFGDINPFVALLSGGG